MQTRTKTFADTKMIGLALVAVVLLAVDLVALGAADRLPGIGADRGPTHLPKAYTGTLQGEGLVGPAISSAANPVVAYWQPGMGEGRLNVVSPNATRAVIAHASLGQGEGWFGGGLKTGHAAVTSEWRAHAACGQGEGLVQHGIPLPNPCTAD